MTPFEKLPDQPLDIGGDSRSGGRTRESGGRKSGSPVGSRGKAPAEGLGTKSPQKLEQNLKLVYDF